MTLTNCIKNYFIPLIITHIWNEKYAIVCIQMQWSLNQINMLPLQRISYYICQWFIASEIQYVKCIRNEIAGKSSEFSLGIRKLLSLLDIRLVLGVAFGLYVILALFLM